MRAWVHANAGLVAGLVVGLVAVVVLVAGGVARPAPERRRADAEFVEAWRRSRSTTVVVEGESVRRMDGGREIRSPFRLVQAPPDRLSSQFGSASGTVDGHEVVCVAGPTSRVDCTPGAPAGPFQEGLDTEIRNLQGYFAAPAVYEAYDAGDGCFELELRRPVPLPQFGSAARFCFDPGTGALVSSEKDVEGAVESSTARSVRPTVGPGDLVLPVQAEGSPGVAAPATTTSR